MQFNPESVGYFSVWIVNSIYLTGMFPQIFLNYKLKTTKGLSNWMLLGATFGYVLYWYHIYLESFPAAYQVMVPLGFSTSIFMILQSFYYDGCSHRRYFCYLSLLIGFIGALIFPLALKYPEKVSEICGWVYTFIWLIYMIPQILKIYVQKSTRGFSFAFITFFAVGVLIEFIAAFFIELSLPIVLNCLRALAGYVIFCMFFYIYRGN
ncbi:PQ-loop repeat-containing protein [Candidatus Babeliales bacterium]|nr:PQ-loop repeat-containing protein [Candidatus Babeliales bacterium]